MDSRHLKRRLSQERGNQKPKAGGFGEITVKALAASLLWFDWLLEWGQRRKGNCVYKAPPPQATEGYLLSFQKGTNLAFGFENGGEGSAEAKQSKKKNVSAYTPEVFRLQFRHKLQLAPWTFINIVSFLDIGNRVTNYGCICILTLLFPSPSFIYCLCCK